MSRSHRAVPCLALAAVLSAVVQAGDPPTTPNQLLLSEGVATPGGAALFPPYALTYGAAGWILDVCAGGGVYCEVLWTEGGDSLASSGHGLAAEIWPSHDTDAFGRLAALVSSGGAGGHVGVLFGAGPAIEVTDPVTGGGLAPNAEWTGMHALELFPGGGLAVRGESGVPPFSLPGDSEQDLLMRYDLPGFGDALNPQVLLRQGALLAGRELRALGGPDNTSWTVNSAGQTLATVWLGGGGPGIPNANAVVLDDTILIEHGRPSVLPEHDWLVLLDDPVDLNEQGDWAVQTQLSPGARDVLVRNGALVAVEGWAAPGLAGSTLTMLHGARLGDDGSLLWYAEWTTLGGAQHSGFFVDDELVVQAGPDLSGNTLLDGQPLVSIQTDLLRWDLADDGGRFGFTGVDGAGDWHTVEVDLAPWTSLGGGLPGSSSTAPLLVGCGELQPGLPASLSLTGAQPGGVTHLVVGLSQAGVLFKGGLLCPAPDVLILGLPLDGAGELVVATTWPAGLPSGTSFWSQFWSEDLGGPAGFSASNCLRGTTP